MVIGNHSSSVLQNVNSSAGTKRQSLWLPTIAYYHIENMRSTLIFSKTPLDLKL